MCKSWMRSTRWTVNTTDQPPERSVSSFRLDQTRFNPDFADADDSLPDDDHRSDILQV